MIYVYFWVIESHDSVENYADIFIISLRNDDIQEFDSKWDGILLSMTKIPHDDILEGLYKLRIRESEKLKTLLELYDLETHQKKLGPDYHRLKAMVKRSIEQEIRKKISVSEMGILRRTSWSRIREQNSVYEEFLAMGNQRTVCERRHLQFPPRYQLAWKKLHRLRILSRSKMSENHRETEVPEAVVPVVERLDGFARITSEKLAITHVVKNGTLQNVCSARQRVVVGLGKSAHSHTVRLMNSRQKGLKRMMTEVQWLC